MELHRQRGLSQTQIGSRSNLSQASIYKLLAGIGTPRATTYLKLAAGFPDAWADYLERHPAFRRELASVLGEVEDPSGKPKSIFEQFIESDFGLAEIRELPAQYQRRYRRRLAMLIRPVINELRAYRRKLRKAARKT